MAMENTLFLGDFPSYKPPFSSGIFQLAMFDDTRGYTFTFAADKGQAFAALAPEAISHIKFHEIPSFS